MADPIVKITTATANHDTTSINFAGTVTGIPKGVSVKLIVDAVVGTFTTTSFTVVMPVPIPTPTPIPTPVPVPLLVPPTWDAASTMLTLSTDKTVATCGAGVRSVARTSISKSSGKWYLPIKASKVGVNLAVGVVNANMPSGTAYLGVEGNGWGFYSCDPTFIFTYWINNNLTWLYDSNKVHTTTDVDGVVYELAWDVTAGLLWARTPSMVTAFGPKAWNCNPNADPATGVAGFDISALGQGPLYFAAGLADDGTSLQTMIPSDLTAIPTGYSYYA